MSKNNAFTISNVILALAILMSISTARAESTASDLNRQIQLLKGIEYYVDRLYLSNLKVLTNTAERIL